MLSRRTVNFLGFVICAGLFGYALVLDFVEKLEPCPLCILQRLALIVLGLVFLAAALQAPRGIGSRVYGLLIMVPGLGGAAIAARHVWLQNLPADQVPSCGPGLGYMLDAFPLSETLKLVFTGSGECAEVSWVFLGLSIPAWALAWFVLLTVVGVVRNFTD